MGEELQYLADELFYILTQKRLSICVAESITAGYLCGAIAKASGISRWLKGGLVCYSPAIKVEVLNIPQEMAAYRYAVNDMVARKMAENAASFFKAQVAISSTGFAEPFEDYLPEAYIGIYIKGFGCDVFHLDLKDVKIRDEARLIVVREGLKNLIHELSTDNKVVV